MNELGRSLYQNLSDALVNSFGPYVLCSDNFCVEHREGDYLPPVFNKPTHENEKARSEFVARQKKQALRRDTFASYIEYAARIILVSILLSVLIPVQTIDGGLTNSGISEMYISFTYIV